MQQRPGGLEAGGTEGSPPPSPEPGTRGLRRGAREPAAGLLPTLETARAATETSKPWGRRPDLLIWMTKEKTRAVGGGLDLSFCFPLSPAGHEQV